VKKLKNKGAVSLFIIIGVIILFGTFSFFYVKNSQEEKIVERSVIDIQKFDPNIQPVYLFTQECMRKAILASAYQFGVRQGYYNITENYLETFFYSIAYYYNKGDINMHDNEFFENEFEKFLNDNILNKCSDFYIFEEQGYEINFLNNSILEVNILDEKIIVKIDRKINVVKDGMNNEISDFFYEIPIRLGYMLDVSRNLVEKIKKEPDAVDMTNLLSYDLDVSIIEFDRCNEIYLLVDQYSKNYIDSEYYSFFFGVSFNEEYCVQEIENVSNYDFELPKYEIENNKPILKAILTQKLNVGETFLYQIQASDPDDEPVFYFSDGVLKNYTNIITGRIEYNTKLEDKGLNLITITVIDSGSAIDQKQFYLEIE
jgi:hypothetical protein